MSRHTPLIQNAHTRTEGLMDRFLDPHNSAIPTQSVGRTIYTRDATYEIEAPHTSEIWGPGKAIERRWASAGIKASQADGSPMRTVHFKYTLAKSQRQCFEGAMDLPGDDTICQCDLDGREQRIDALSPIPTLPASDFFYSHRGHYPGCPFDTRDATPDLVYSSTSPTPSDAGGESNTLQVTSYLDIRSQKKHAYYSEQPVHAVVMDREVVIDMDECRNR
ncbi:hypothetical protein OBBRIDRAFT_789021 [Obba rivulosa]|uniref:Uncharacterized protein n=1 Tax=Obba rivulosa TaxID=1052685 RepID=A0A8E2DSA3_9APHY|nr:hypothetical protein OBBRIDRAFT_789021 [Obba rivulosa]